MAKTAWPNAIRSMSHPFSVKDRGETKRPDLLRRFTSTPHATDLRLMQRTVRLESNRKDVLEFALKFFERYQHGRAGKSEFLWRLVCETDPQVQSTAVQFSAFSDLGLRYVNIEQRGFLTVDIERREARGFLGDRFVEGEPRFRHRPPLDVLFCMSAASLGLTALCGGCVGLNNRG